MRPCPKCKLSAFCLTEPNRVLMLHDVIESRITSEEANKGTEQDFQRYVRGVERGVLESLPRGCVALRRYGEQQ